jgi:iron(III) transport system ATP-binding protein
MQMQQRTEFEGHTSAGAPAGLRTLPSGAAPALSSPLPGTRAHSEAAPAHPGFLTLEAVGLRYPGQRDSLLAGVSFSLAQGEIGCLLGPSGCGKSSLLRAIAGFMPLQAGRIALNGRVLSGDGAMVLPNERGVGMVFQDFALFPHLNVAQNIGFGLKALPAAERDQRVAELLQLADLSALAARYPHEISGGQQQRVALARALAPRPALMLLDEPFSSLDVDLRERLSSEVRALLKATGTTAILVTHDQHEAFAMADRLGVIHGGQLLQWDSPYNLYHQPATRVVADFVGEGAFVPGELHQPADHGHDHVLIELGWITPPDKCNHPHLPPRHVDVLLRPDDVVHDDHSALQATIVRKAFRGAEFMYTLRLPSGREILTLVPSHHDHAIGEAIGIRLQADHVVWFDRT